MGQFVVHRYPGAWVRVTFKCRSDEKIGCLKPAIDRELDYLCTLRYTDEEIAYLRTIDWLAPDFVDYLRRFYMFREQVHTEVDADGQLVMWAEGPWRDVIWFEVPCLAIVEELYTARHLHREYKDRELDVFWNDTQRRLEEKVKLFNELYAKHPFTLSEFGLRRRFSRTWHDYVVGYLKDNCAAFVGTSDVSLARKYNVKPMGTMAHEMYMGLQGCKVQLREVQRETWRQWVEEFRGKNGILLSDIFGFNACLNDMDWYVANSFQGCRHDSGDPFTWGEKLIAKY
jgi:nicotinate phosphoribosyltransferase